jgi:N-acetyl-anhydromuramyl-L-alanine amidase AmpD
MMIRYTFIRSENVSERNPNAPIRGIVLHHTATTDLKQTIKILTEAKYQVSAHFLIAIDGRIFQLVDTKLKAWHAGVSNWRGLGEKNIWDPDSKISYNHASVGIEIMNDGVQPFTNKQYDAAITLCKQLKAEYTAIEDCNIVAHGDISPGRKVDPHVGFNWKLLFENGIGIYSDKMVSTPCKLHHIGDKHEQIATLKQKLGKFGFTLNTSSSEYDAELDNVAKAFKRHHCPETYSDENTLGWDNLADARLDDLLHKYYGMEQTENG